MNPNDYPELALDDFLPGDLVLAGNGLSIILLVLSIQRGTSVHEYNDTAHKSITRKSFVLASRHVMNGPVREWYFYESEEDDIAYRLISRVVK